MIISAKTLRGRTVGGPGHKEHKKRQNPDEQLLFHGFPSIPPPTFPPTQGDGIRVSTLLTNPSSKLTDRRHGRCSVAKAKATVEEDVLEKQSVGAQDKNVHDLTSLMDKKKIGLEINEARPHDKLPTEVLGYGPTHGGRDRHTCIAIRDVSKLKAILDVLVSLHAEQVGRPAIFTRDPDANARVYSIAGRRGLEMDGRGVHAAIFKIEF
ncbi:hypothetical protein DVH24_006189 [Malus domestica]|uniref:Uncharacterized protein n=1 Tax=Malus domestica TaxID=3750 RepID=A0A498KXJ0_MALDO|nr:hypothetical protein DVH24_006189 [Malus domestica]